MNTTHHLVAIALLSAASAAPAGAQPKGKPLPEPLPMGIPYVYQPGNPYWYAPVVTSFPPGHVIWHAPTGTYTTIYPATRPVVIQKPSGPVMMFVHTAPVVVGPTWALAPVRTFLPHGW